MSRRRNLTEGHIPKQLTNLTLPMMLGIISMVAFNLVDTYFVGKLGKTQLAALSFTFPVIMVIFSIIQGLGIGATALISKSIGKGLKAKAARETTDALALSFLIGGIFILFGSLTITPTFKLLGADDSIIPYIEEYMSVWYLALLFIIVPFVGNSAIRATGDARTPSLIMIFAVIINAILDPMLIFGYGPIPALGLKGAAYATAISRGMTMVLSLAILFYREKLITLTIPSRKVFIGCWKAILYIGIPSGLSRMVIPLVSGIMTSILSTFGESAVAAFGVGTRVEFLATSILIALSASIGPFVGQNFGAGKFDRIRKALNFSYIFSLIWGFGIAIVLFIFSKQVSSLFTSDPDIINYTSLYLSILPISYGFYGIVQIVNSNLNTLNSPIHASLIIAFQMFVIAIPSIYFGKYFFGISGVFAGWMLGYMIGGMISFIVNKWKYKKIEAAFK